MKIFEEKKIMKDIPIIVCRRDDGCKKPLVIISHGFTGSKEDIKKKGYLEELAESGYFAVAIDNRLHGDRPEPNFRTAVIDSFGKVNLLVLREAIKKTADDVKLLIDELSVIEDVEEDKIAVIGVSMGGFVTFRAIVIDDRIKVGIPIISSPYWDDIPGDIPIVNNEITEIELNSLSVKYQPSQHLDKFYPTALLLQIGDKDMHYDINKVKNFYNELKNFYCDSPEKLRLIIYPNTKHELKQEMWEQALKWLKGNF